MVKLSFNTNDIVLLMGGNIENEGGNNQQFGTCLQDGVPFILGLLKLLKL